MNTALLFSIALSLFLMTFMGAETRIDEVYNFLVSADEDIYGDLVLLSGVPIVAVPIFALFKKVKG